MSTAQSNRDRANHDRDEDQNLTDAPAYDPALGERSQAVDESQVVDPRDLVYTSRIDGNLQEILSNPAVMPQTYLSEAHDQRADYYRDVDQSYVADPNYLEQSQMHTEKHQPEE